MFGKKAIMLFTITLITLTVFFTGCARKGKQMSATMPEAGLQGDLRDEGASDSGLDQAPRDRTFSEARGELQTVYFDYDSAALKPEAKARLEKAADWLNTNPNASVQIAGHCDERGTNEYNLALGDRRAAAAKRYLTGLGIDSSRVFTISYGEERPAVEGHDESAWKHNRRDEFKVSL